MSTSPSNPPPDALMQMARAFLTHDHALFRTIDLTHQCVTRGRTSMLATAASEFDDGEGLAHSGLHAIILDSVFGLTVFTTLDELKPIATIDLRVDNIARAKTGERLVCEATCDGMRGDVAYVSGRLTAEASGQTLATGAGAFMTGTRGKMPGMRL